MLPGCGNSDALNVDSFRFFSSLEVVLFEFLRFE